jgi:peroxiredoxin
MPSYLIALLTFAWLAILAGGWLGWQLLRQNGRLLLRLDELEKRLDTLEFGEDDQPTGLTVGGAAPAFELADLAGGRQSLTQFRGQALLLIFFNPECGYCRELMQKLAAVAAGFQPAGEGGILPPGQNAHSTGSPERAKDSEPTPGNSAGLEARLTGRQGCLPLRVLILTTGDAEKNRQFFAEHQISFPVLLQNDGEVAKAYQVNGTPTGYLISADGKIASELAIGAEALLKLASAPPPQLSTLNPQPEDPSLLTSAATIDGDGRANRFSNRSLARSKIKRDGLKAGTPAPDFRLPRLDGRGEFALSELRGRQVLLVFSSPGCGPCNTLAPELEKFHRRHNSTFSVTQTLESERKPLTPSLSPSDGERVADRPGEGKSAETTVVMISKGEPKENRAKVKEYGLTFPIVLQQQWEISRRYAMFATPVAYLIDEHGVIANDVAIGTDAILELLKRSEVSNDRGNRIQPRLSLVAPLPLDTLTV